MFNALANTQTILPVPGIEPDPGTLIQPSTTQPLLPGLPANTNNPVPATPTTPTAQRGSANGNNRLPTGSSESTQSGTYTDTSTSVQSGTGTSQLTPYEPMLQALNEIFGRGLGAFNQTQGQQYGGDFFAGANATQTGGLQALLTAAGALGSGADPTRRFANDLISGTYLNHETNPYLSGAVEAALRPVNERYFNELVPSLEDAAIAGGAYGGSANRLLREDLATNYAREAGGLSTQAYLANYNAERDRQFMAPELFNAADEMSLLGPQLQLTAGDLQQGWEQTGLDNQLAQFNEGLSAPWRGFEDLMSVLGLGLPYGTQTSEQNGTTTTTGEGTTEGTTNTQEYRPRGGLAGGLQGGIGGAATGARIGLMLGHPIIGAILGGLAGGIGGGLG